MRDRDKLSEKLKYWRAERPDEWTMDEFIRQSKRMEDAIVGFMSEFHGEYHFDSDAGCLEFIDQYADITLQAITELEQELDALREED